MKLETPVKYRGTHIQILNSGAKLMLDANGALLTKEQMIEVMARVNLHDELVEVCKKLVEAGERELNRQHESDPECFGAVVRMAEEVLAKAKEKP